MNSSPENCGVPWCSICGVCHDPGRDVTNPAIDYNMLTSFSQPIDLNSYSQSLQPSAYFPSPLSNSIPATAASQYTWNAVTTTVDFSDLGSYLVDGSFVFNQQHPEGPYPTAAHSPAASKSTPSFSPIACPSISSSSQDASTPSTSQTIRLSKCTVVMSPERFLRLKFK